MIFFYDAVRLAIQLDDRPIISDYEIHRFALKVLLNKEVDGQKVKRIPASWDVDKTRKLIRALEARQALAQDNDFKSGIWRVVQTTKSGSAEAIACLADPFCYVSHLSAMERYHFTNRSPVALQLTTPARAIWNEMRDQKVSKDLPGDETGGARLLRQYNFKETLRRRAVSLHETSHPSPPAPIKGEPTRITSIGQTFVDMLSEPQLCGGMRHVLEVWNDHAEQWVGQILDAVNRNHQKIIKARAGYILDEYLQVKHPGIESLTAFAQRGGSRKLDPDGPYMPVFSEKWMISLNV